jgi:hypothetical protein
VQKDLNLMIVENVFKYDGINNKIKNINHIN